MGSTERRLRKNAARRKAGSAELIHKFRAAAGPVFEENFTPDCCLNATRVCIDVMAHFKVEASPLVVRTIGMDKIWTEHFDAHGGPPDNEAQAQEWTDAGGWSIGIDDRMGADDPRLNPTSNREVPGWVGHLVTVIGGSVLLDCSAGQMSRPLRGIVIPQMMSAPVSETFLAGDGVRAFEDGTGSRLMYYAVPGNRTFEGTPGFQQSPHNKAIADEIVRRMNRRY